MALVISMCVLTYGYDSSFTGTATTQKSFQQDFGMDNMSKSALNDVSSSLTSVCSSSPLPKSRPVLIIAQIRLAASSEHSLPSLLLGASRSSLDCHLVIHQLRN
ncbi:hypothetical protein PMIN03_006870 [Paraphaeosphaeria minitans]